MIGVIKNKKKPPKPPKNKKTIVNIRKTSVTLNELMIFKEKYHYTKIKTQRNA